MIPTIYLSVPVTINWTEVNKVVSRIVGTVAHDTRITYWARNTKYNQNLVHNCDIFMFMTPNNNWETNINSLPSGVYRELILAISQDKPIFMVYKNREGIYNIYSFRKSNNTIGGEAGTSAIIWDKIKELSGHKNPMLPKDSFDAPKCPETVVYFDRRLLL